MPKVTYFYLEVIFLYCLPIFGMWLFTGLLAYRPYLFLFGALYVFFRGIQAKKTSRDWGVTTNGWQHDLHQLNVINLVLPVLAFTTLTFADPTTRTWLIGYDMLSASLPIRLILYSLVSVPIQEFIFRSYLVWRLEDLKWSTSSIIWTSTIIFVIGHLPFQSPLMLVVVAVMGFVYARIYSKHKNIWPIIISHAIIGSILMLIRNYFLPY